MDTAFSKARQLFVLAAGLALGIGIFRYTLATPPALNFPEANLNITDAASFGQVAAYRCNGSVYGPPELGVGHIYAPAAVLFTLAVHRALGLEPTPPSARWLGQACFALALVLLGLCVHRETGAGLAWVALGCLGAWFMQVQTGTFESVYMGHFRLLLLSLLWLSCTFEGSGSALLSVLWVVLLGLSSPNYLACGLGLLPRYRQHPGQRGLLLLGGAAGACLLAWVFAAPLRLYWLLAVPLAEPHKAWMAALRDCLRLATGGPFLVQGLAGLAAGSLAGKAHRPWAWLGLAVLLAGLPPTLKLGGSPANLAPFVWIAWPAGIVFALEGPRRAAKALALGFLCFLIVAGWPLIDGSAGPRQPTAVDRGNQAHLEQILDWAGGQGWHVWADCAPGYFSSRRLPYVFDVTHMWEQQVGGDKRSLQTFKRALDSKRFDLIAVHVDPVGLEPISRCLGAGFLDYLSRNYLLTSIFTRDPAGDPGLGDTRVNGSFAIFIATAKKKDLFDRSGLGATPP